MGSILLKPMAGSVLFFGWYPMFGVCFLYRTPKGKNTLRDVGGKFQAKNRHTPKQSTGSTSPVARFSTESRSDPEARHARASFPRLALCDVDLREGARPVSRLGRDHSCLSSRGLSHAACLTSFRCAEMLGSGKKNATLFRSCGSRCHVLVLVWRGDINRLRP